MVTVSHTADGLNGWNVSDPVSVTVSASDDVALATLACTVDAISVDLTPTFVAGDTTYAGTLSVTSDGSHAIECAGTDTSANSGTGTDTATIDTVKPLTAILGFSNGQTFATGSTPPTVSCDTTDTTSGVATAATASADNTALHANGVGTVTITCDGGTDNAGNGDTAVQATYIVNYGGLSGILQPISSDNTKLFRRGKTVPVKFRVAGDEPNGFSVAGWVIEQKPVSCTGDFDGLDRASRSRRPHRPRDSATTRSTTSTSITPTTAPPPEAAVGGCAPISTMARPRPGPAHSRSRHSRGARRETTGAVLSGPCRRRLMRPSRSFASAACVARVARAENAPFDAGTRSAGAQ